MKFLALFLFLATTAVQAEHAGRGLMRHSKPGIDDGQPSAEVVELPVLYMQVAEVVRLPVVNAPAARLIANPERAPLAPIFSAVPTAHSRDPLPPVFSAIPSAEAAALHTISALCTPKLVDAFEAPPKVAEILDPPHPTIKETVAQLYNSVPEVIARPPDPGPTAEQLALMREFHLSSPPTIHNVNGSVRAAGRSSAGAAISPAEQPVYHQPYCPECERQRRRNY